MIDRLFARKEVDRDALKKFEITVGLRYGFVFGLILVLVGWGVDAWESANTSLELSWAKLPLATITIVSLCALAGTLAARLKRSLVKMVVWGAFGAITGLVAIHLPFEGASAIATLSDPALGNTPIFPFGPAARERVVGMMAFGAAAGIVAAWAQRIANIWAWDQSSADNRMTLGAWATLLVCAPIAIGLGAVYDGGANASIRGPARLTQRLIEVGLATPPNLDLNRVGARQALDYGLTARWRDNFSTRYVQRIAGFNTRTLTEEYIDTEFDTGFIWRCQITQDGSNIRRCIDLRETYRDWITQFLRTGQIRCDECVLRIEPEAIAWQMQNALGLESPKQIDIFHHSGGVVIVRAVLENRVVECRIVGAEPVNLQGCNYMK